MIPEIKKGTKSNFLSLVLSDAGMGYIHSIFENTFNIIFEGNLIHFGKMYSGVSAFGLLLPNYYLESIMDAIEIEDRVKVQSGSLTIYTRTKTWKIKTTSFETIDCRVPIMESIEQEFLNILLSKFHTLSIENKTGILYSEKDRILLNKFQEAQWDDQIFHRPFIAHFIGRGIGLTPSGDDMLMGILMMYQALRWKEDWTVTLSDQLELIKTTDVSMAYYEALLEGYTSSFFVDFLQAIKDKDLTNWDELINRISKYGHTSGWDTLYGIYLFLQKLVKPEESLFQK